MYVCVRVCVSVYACIHGWVCACNTSFASFVMWLMVAPPDSNHVVETRWGQGALTLVLQANSKGTSCTHVIHPEEGDVLAPRSGQVTAIVNGPPPF